MSERSSAGLAFSERGSGPAVVLLHGHPFDRRLWLPQLAALADEFRLIAPDLPGYGRSPVQPGTVTMRALAQAVAELLDELGVAETVAVGLSMGGLVAMELALADPARVRGLVLAATTAAPLDQEEAERRRATADTLERDGMLSAVVEMAGRLFGTRARREPALVAPVLQMMIETPPAGAAAALRGRAERPDYRTLMAPLGLPALIVAGDEDSFGGEQVVSQLRDTFPGSELLALPGVGHLPNLEEPERFNAALRAFARRVSSPA